MKRVIDLIFSTANPRIEPVYILIAVLLAVAVAAVMEYVRAQGKATMNQSFAMVLLTVYLFLVFASTVFSRISTDDYCYELIPFWSYREILNGSESLFWEDVLNVIMLFPMGILLPIVMGDGGQDKIFQRVILTAFLTSLVIELLQLVLRRGLFEFDDMFHNTLGAMIAYWFYRWIRNRRSAR